MERRTLLKGLGTGTLAALAGCTGSADTNAEANAESNEETPADTETEEPTESPTPSPEPTEKEPQKRVEVVDEEQYETDFGSVGVKGTVQNTADKTLSYVGVEVKFYNAEDTRIGEALDNTSDLGAGEKWAYDAVAMDVDPEEYDHYELKTDVKDY